MRKLLFSLLLTGLVFAFGASPASAQSSISLASPSSGTVTFTSATPGTGGTDMTMLLGSCSLGGSCITGTASGTGALASSGFYKISGEILGLFSTSTGNWDAVGTLAFAYNSAADLVSGTNFLTGTLSLINLTQSGATGTFNTNLVANLTITDGSLMSVFTAAGGIATVTITLPISSLSTLVGSTTATTVTGVIFPTPEPGSMILLGSGLLAVGGFLRRRITRPV